MVTLRRDARGNFSARKRLPADVQDEYGRRYGQRFEAKFFAAASKGVAKAKQEFRDWETEVAGRRTGESATLSIQQARALAGEWYSWFIAKHPVNDRGKWEELQGRVQEALQDAIDEDAWERFGPDELWREDPELRIAVRPVLADVGETAQFLAMKKLTLNSEARDSFLDWLYKDLDAALRRLVRRADGDYSSDKYAARFPKFEGSDTGETPQQLFEAWVHERKPARSSVQSWRYVFAAMTLRFKDRSAASISREEAQEWIRSCVGPRSESTVRRNWITPSKTVFGWAVEHKRIPHNPFCPGKDHSSKEAQVTRDTGFPAGRMAHYLAGIAGHSRHCGTTLGALALCLHRCAAR